MRAARLALSVRPWMAEPDLCYMEVLQLNSYSDRNEVSQHEEVRVWIPDGRSYMDVKQHNIIHINKSKLCCAKAQPTGSRA
ncbi:hypothetical protein PP2015_437 [Pseudoalteromonas phenolica]|uniref:Uncharacterized protein n=1 Tax=Pseudoalteromonas phenolica TaxID=161398 RepID=A0A0S2JYA1_9GAMM|nr:hypothetical protein PP2015_437 [Pseudoalteromonas phenolica]